jgi:ABC-type branched-subunit amino acid transport system substrate-binding protein/streptogramin lyase/tetratricopeptide (TPR) repeat protein
MVLDSGAGTMSDRATGVFVGRELELEALLAGLEETLAGHGRLFLISGEPGIGKSRLADELARHAEELGADVLVGRCWEAGGAPAFWPWVHAIRTRVRGSDRETLRSQLGAGGPDLAQIIPELRELFPDLPRPPSVDPEGARFRLFDAIASFLRNTAQAKPLVLVLDDLHAADEPSLLLLQFVARELGESRLLVLAAYRDVDPALTDPLATTVSDLAREPVTRALPLTGLVRPDVARFIELTVDCAPTAELAAAVHTETDGNPFFVGEIARLLASEGPLDEAAPRLAIPQSLKKVIGRRLSHLSAECNSMLTLASVLGPEFDLEALARVTGLERDLLFELLDEATAARVVSENPVAVSRLRFAHGLIRDAVHETLPRARRMQLHRQVGEALESLYENDLESHLAELAHHFFIAGDHRRAGDYARRAGARAVVLLAYEEAVRLYEMALGLTEDAYDRCDLLIALGDAQARAGDSRKAKETFLQAAELAEKAGLPDRLARAALGYGGRFVWARSGADRQTVPLLERALAVLEERDSRLRAMLLARLSGALRDDPSREPRAAHSQEAVDIARRIGDAETLAYALDGRFAATWGPENAEERLAIATELVRLGEESGDKERAFQGHDYRNCVLFELGDIRARQAELEAIAQLADELRQPAQLWILFTTRAMQALLEGRFDEAEELIEETLRHGQGAQRWEAVLAHRLQMFVLRREQGRLEEIELLIERTVDEYSTRPMVGCVQACLHAELGRRTKALRTFEDLAANDFADVNVDNDWCFGMSMLAQACAALGEARSAGTLYGLLLPYAERIAAYNTEVAIGPVAYYLGILASTMLRRDEAVEHFEAALEMNARIGARPWLAHTNYDYARTLIARGAEGDAERATELLDSALATCRELGMEALEAKVSTLLSELGPIEASVEKSFAGYSIEDDIGRGGMAVVYRATDLELDRPVALKLIAPELAEDERFRERFLRESRLAASLDHGNVIPIYEAGEADGRLFLAMRYVEGEDLKSLLRREGKLPPQQALAICAQVASALDAAHRRGLVHRDVKPANVLLDEEEHVYLADFGLTKQLAEGGGATRTGQLVGTLDYLAPEQIRGEELDGRTDQYALACVLYECLAGKPPFRRETEAEALWAHMQEEPPPLRDDPKLDPVLARGLAKAKEERYPTCGELVVAARSALGLEVRAQQRPFVPPALLRQGRKLLVAGALLLAGGTASAVLELMQGSGGGLAAVAPNSVGAIDPKTSRIVAQIPVVGRPSRLAIGGGTVWVGSDESGTVSALDPHTQRATKLVAIGGFPSDLAVGERAVWVVDGKSGLVDKVDPSYGVVASRIRIAAANPVYDSSREVIDPTSVAAGSGSVWLTDGSRKLTRIDPTTNKVVQRIDLRSPLDGVAVGAGGVWAISGASATAIGLDRRGRVTVRIPIVSEPRFDSPYPLAVSVGDGFVWVLNGNTGTVTKVDPRQRVVSATIPIGIGHGPARLAVGDGAAWIADTDGTLVRIDATTNAVEATAIGHRLKDVAAAAGTVWVTAGSGLSSVSTEANVSGGRVLPLPTSSCSPIYYGGGGQPRYLIASDLPLQGLGTTTPQMSQAIQFVLRQHRFRAGRYAVGYQSCDDSTVKVQPQSWSAARCAANAHAYARDASVIGVIGALNSSCSQIEVPITNRAPGGPLGMISPDNTYVGLTHSGPGTARGEPRSYYPTGKRNFVHIEATDDVQGAADALLGRRLGVRRVYLDGFGVPYGVVLAQAFKSAAAKLGIRIVGSYVDTGPPPSYKPLAARIRRTGADGVFIAGFLVGGSSGTLIRDLRAGLGPGVRIMAPDGFADFTQLVNVAGAAAEGMTVSVAGLPNEQLPAPGKKFVAAFGAAVGERPTVTSVYAAEAVEVLLDAIARSNGSRASVIDQLFKTKVSNGILGSFSINRNGDTTAGAVTIYRIVHGSPTVFEVITPPPSLVR